MPVFVPPAEQSIYFTHASPLIIACSERMWIQQAGALEDIFVSRRKANKAQGVTNTDGSCAVCMRAVEVCRLVYETSLFESL